MLDAILVCVLLFLAYQDIKSRRVHVLGILLLAILAGLTIFRTNTLSAAATIWIVNLLVLLIWGVCSYLVWGVFIKKRQKRFFDEVLGKGDVWFVLASTSLVGPQLFVLSLLVSFGIGLLTSKIWYPVPQITWMAIVFSGVIGMDMLGVIESRFELIVV